MRSQSKVLRKFKEYFGDMDCKIRNLTLEDVKGFGLVGMLRRKGEAWSLREMRTCGVVIREMRTACTSSL